MSKPSLKSLTISVNSIKYIRKERDRTHNQKISFPPHILKSMLNIKYNFFKYKKSNFYRKEGILFMKNFKRQDILKNFLQKRIQENKKLFTQEELELIEKNIKTIKKIYILGLKDLNDIK